MIKEKWLLNMSYLEWFKQIIISFFGIACIGIAIAFNNLAGLGNDPVSVFFDGARVVLFNLTGINNLGLVANIINYTLLIVIFFIAREYVHIGTLIYVIPLGTFISLGVWIFNSLHIPPNVLIWQVVMSLIGCFLLFLGLAIVISLDIGLDPWSALIMFLVEKTNKQFKVIKIIIDVTVLLIGWAMGGNFFVTTVFAAIFGGPAIQKINQILNKTILKPFNVNKDNNK